jgi:hypothetical protein
MLNVIKIGWSLFSLKLNIIGRFQVVLENKYQLYTYLNKIFRKAVVSPIIDAIRDSDFEIIASPNNMRYNYKN